MTKLLRVVGVGMLLVACGSPDGAPLASETGGSAGSAGAPAAAGSSGSGGLAQKPTPQIFPTYCVTEVVAESAECDADHLMVIRCSTALQPPDFEYCYDPKGVPYGTVWCCKPAFANDCGDLCR